jgi:uncharacterized protein (DUF1800 family)
MTTNNLKGLSVEAGKALIVGALCSLMVSPEAIAAAEMPAHAATVTSPLKKAPLTQDEKTLHALNRFTFGPRPGDEAMVHKLGLEAWFEAQLHPEQINDDALETKLAEFPALKLSIGEIMQKYPSSNTLRQMARTQAPLPTDPIEHAIYADSMEFYNAQQKAAGKIAAKEARKDGDADMTATAGDTMSTQKPAAVDDSMTAEVATNAKGKPRKLNEPRMPYEQMQELLALPASERFEHMVAMSPEEMVSLRKGMRLYQEGGLMQGMTPEQKQDVLAMQGGDRLIGGQALEERLLRDVYSDRQLQAVLDDFWLNHFSVYVRKNQNEPYLLASYDRDAILPNAMGKFEDLLVATAKSPAMLMYLDNWLSIGPDSQAAQRGKKISQLAPNSQAAKVLPKGINENYARELMELHTLGVGGGYTQKDVIEVAKCFTGWTIDRPYGGKGYRGSVEGVQGEFVFDPARHEGGTKVVLGHTIQEGGMNEGLEVLHILATSTATAKFVSTKLAVRFVSDTPPASLIDKMSATFLKSDGDIKAVMSTMFHAPEFWSPTVYRAKVKTPIEFMASALRASDASVGNPIALVQAMGGLGMPIYGMQTPNGYSWKSDEWVSSNALVSRMNFALVLSSSRVPGAKMNWPEVLGDSSDATIATSPTPKTEMKLENVILGASAGAHTRATVLANYNDPTVQQQAAQSFAKTADAASANMSSNDSMTSTETGGKAKMKQVDAAALYGKKGGGGYGQQFLTDKPETPLDTMAGLLMGSPDFQRR